MYGTFQGKCLLRVIFMAMCSWPFTWKILMISVFYLKLQYFARYHTILYYITIQYFIFLWFFVVLYHTQTQYICRGECML
jgi:hypothetical protein